MMRRGHFNFFYLQGLLGAEIVLSLVCEDRLVKNEIGVDRRERCRVLIPLQTLEGARRE